MNSASERVSERVSCGLAGMVGTSLGVGGVELGAGAELCLCLSHGGHCRGCSRVVPCPESCVVVWELLEESPWPVLEVGAPGA